MFRIIAALALACVLSACQTSNPAAWGQIAAGVGAVLGETKIDPQIERVSTKLAAYCVEAQNAAIAVDLLAPPKVQRAAQGCSRRRRELLRVAAAQRRQRDR